MNLKNLAESRIVIDSNSGKHFIKGAKVSVAEILLEIIEGKDEADIIRAYRSIRLDDIKACLAYSYCVADNIALKMPTSTGGSKTVQKNLEVERELREQGFNIFYQNLETQASVQEEMTAAHVNRIKQMKKQQQENQAQKIQAPTKRAYDLIIELAATEKTHIFADTDAIEQKLDMSSDNYIFKIRADNKAWLTYSVKDGVEIDKQMRRNLKVRYHDNGEDKEAIFEGYLTTDRKHKIFLERSEEGKTCGRAL